MRQMLVARGVGLITAVAGCASDQPPPPEHAQVSAAPQYAVSGPKPLPPPNWEDTLPPPPFYDPPLVSQQMPEESAFVNAYNAVGRPKILVFVNRTLDGNLVPVNPDGPVVTFDRRVNYTSVNGPTVYRAATDVYLHPGQYDELAGKSLDYQAIESILSDWMSADGRVQILSPTLARQRLNEQQVKDLQSGRPIVGRDIAEQLDAHILIQVQAHPTRQTLAGLQVRMVAEAIDLKHDGVSLARAVVDVPPPLDKVQINVRTRFLARKLMDGMIGSWEATALRPSAPAPGQVPQTQPAAGAQNDAPVWPVTPAATVAVPTPPAATLSPAATVPPASGPTSAPSAPPSDGAPGSSTK